MTAVDPAAAGSAGAAGSAHLSDGDAVLAAIIERVGPLGAPGDGRPADLYAALVRAIVGQQLSVHAARAIYGRVLDRFGGRPPTPREVLDDDPEELRAAGGLSRAKTASLRSLAEHVENGRLRLADLSDLPDEEVIAELVQVKGIGVWSAHMFLIFTLERPDVLAVGDLGVRRAVERAWGLEGLPAAEELERMSELWRPHRSLACRYLWASLSNAPA